MTDVLLVEACPVVAVVLTIAVVAAIVRLVVLAAGAVVGLIRERRRR